MKKLIVYNKEPKHRHVKICKKYGDDNLMENIPNEFYAGIPKIKGFVRYETGTLMMMDHSISPHTDTWIYRYGNPRMQRTIFWMLCGSVIFKVDGYESTTMTCGDYVIFDHRHEHMVFAYELWLGASWQVKK
jgi:hypothetical protein